MSSKFDFSILDGGVATELEARGHSLNDKLWSARLLKEQPDAIADVHLAYLKSGADVITSCSYQASVEGFMVAGIDRASAEQLIVSSVMLSKRACSEFASMAPANTEKQMSPRVAAGVGPYGAPIGDGSEYTGRYDCNLSQLLDFHHDRWHLLLSAAPDLMLCETIPSKMEAVALLRLVEATARPTWISFSCRNDRQISDGTPIEDVARLLLDSSAAGIGINCTPPELISPLVNRVRSVSAELPILVYPNSGETYEIASQTWNGKSADSPLVEMARDWVKAGVNMIGGCCRTSPDDIKSLKTLRDD